MAGALRPVVVLMLLASVLFVAAGVLDGAYPGGTTGELGALAGISYVFALINTVVAVLVARGSERSLALRMGLSLFFVIERPVSAILVGPKSTASVSVHLVTAFVEFVILLSGLRVWQLGNSAPADADELLALDAHATAEAVAPAMTGPAATESESARRPTGTLPARFAWLIGVTALLLAAALVADGVVTGFLPGGRQWGLSGESSGWLVYLYAVVALAVATRAVHGGRAALRLLTVTGLIFFIERAFSPFVIRVVDPLSLGLHVLAAFIALGVALASAGAIRAQGAGGDGDVASLEAA